MAARKEQFLIADLYCGGGGSSDGMIEACEEYGLDPKLVAVNHWNIAIETNKLNHPNAKTICASVEQVKPRQAVPGGRLNVMWASPECTNHSTAKGGRPKDEQSRATAWDVLKWAQELYIDVIYIENVKEFLDWGPLNTKGHPIKSKKGDTFRAYIATLESMGYRVDWQIMNAADFGAATSRRRLIIQAVRGNNQIYWPEPTHSASADNLFGQQPYVAAKTIIDFSIPGKSIFNRPVPLAVKTLKRIYAGGFKIWDIDNIRRFGPLLRQEIIRACKYEGKKRKGCCPFNVLAELPHILPTGEDLNSFMVIMRGQSVCRDINQPVPTIMASGQGHVGIVTPIIIKLRGTGTAADVNAPTPTITAGGTHLGLAEGFVTRFNGGDNRNHSIDNPLPVQDTSNRYGWVDPMVAVMKGNSDCQTIEQPVPTLTTKEHIALVNPVVVDMSHPGEDGDSRAYSAEQPLKTITCRNNMAVADPIVIATGHTGAKDRSRSVNEPLSTIVTKAEHCLVEAMVLHQMTPGRTRTTEEPLPTITTVCRHGLVRPFVVKFYGSGENVKSVDVPLDTVTTKDRFGVVDGDLVMLDIRFRMFQPHELAAAMSFPKTYQFAGTKTDAVKMIGNAVPPYLARALMRSRLASRRPILKKLTGNARQELIQQGA